MSGTNQAGNAVTQGAKDDLVTAYNNAAGQTPVTTVPTELGGTTKTAGIYASDAGTFGIIGTLTLDAQGDPDAVFIFKTRSTLITAGSSRVVIANSAQACHVFWQVGSSATLGTNSTFVGTIMALTSATLTTGASVDGRVLARNGAVTLDGNTVSKAVCAATTTGGSTTTTDGSTTTDNSTVTSGSITAAIKITKKASDSKLRLGPKHITFTFKVTNTGNVALSDVSVKDDKCHSVKFVSGDSNDDSKLDITETWKYHSTKKVSETETDKATASGSYGDLKVHDHAKATVDVHETEKKTVPSLPNAGVGPEDLGSAPWNVIIPTGIFASLSSFYLAR